MYNARGPSPLVFFFPRSHTAPPSRQSRWWHIQAPRRVRPLFSSLLFSVVRSACVFLFAFRVGLRLSVCRTLTFPFSFSCFYCRLVFFDQVSVFLCDRRYTDFSLVCWHDPLGGVLHILVWSSVWGWLAFILGNLTRCEREASAPLGFRRTACHSSSVRPVAFQGWRIVFLPSW